MRLDRAAALSGLTRAEAKRAVASGRVRVKGESVRDAAVQVDPADVSVDGRPVQAGEVYVMVHKPAGLLTATEDKRLPTVTDLLPEPVRRRNPGPVGRLDRDVTGLVIMTTDGQLAHRLISPRWKAEKVYRAWCEGRLTEADVARFAGGIELSDFTARPAGLAIIAAEDNGSVADVTLTEGKFHQVKRMFAAVGHPLNRLHRLRIGCVTLDDALAPGDCRPLTEEEVAGLHRLCGMDDH
jgi:16S rRNA pseudouridine516 synthase